MRRPTVAVVAVLGLVALLVGVGLRTIWQPADRLSATASLPEPGTIVITAPGLLEARPGPVTVRARAKDGGPVVLAVGREGDVTAYVQGATGATLTGFEADDVGRLTSSALPVDPEGPVTLPDPAASDLWVQREAGTGTAELQYGQRDGRWLLVAAGNGSSPAPDTVTLTWPGQHPTPWSWVLVAAGLVLLVAAAVLLARERRSGGEEQG